MFPPRFLRRSAMLLPTPPTKSAPFGPSSLFRLSEPFSRCQGKKSHSFFRIFTKLSFRLSAGSGRLDMDDWMVGLTQGGAVRLNKMGNPSNGPATKKWLFCINNHGKIQIYRLNVHKLGTCRKRFGYLVARVHQNGPTVPKS